MSLKLHTCDTVGAHFLGTCPTLPEGHMENACVCVGGNPSACSSGCVNKLSGPRDNLAPTSGGTLGI